jgi:hypothetical protein
MRIGFDSLLQPARRTASTTEKLVKGAASLALSGVAVGAAMIIKPEIFDVYDDEYPLHPEGSAASPGEYPLRPSGLPSSSELLAAMTPYEIDADFVELNVANTGFLPRSEGPSPNPNFDTVPLIDDKIYF